ncbi:MAG: hypothetical protein ACREGI_05875 [Candidatus Levyibacteriota bacterium]
MGIASVDMPRPPIEALSPRRSPLLATHKPAGIIPLPNGERRGVFIHPAFVNAKPTDTIMFYVKKVGGMQQLPPDVDFATTEVSRRDQIQLDVSSGRERRIGARIFKRGGNVQVSFEQEGLNLVPQEDRPVFLRKMPNGKLVPVTAEKADSHTYAIALFYDEKKEQHVIIERGKNDPLTVSLQAA